MTHPNIYHSIQNDGDLRSSCASAGQRAVSEGRASSCTSAEQGLSGCTKMPTLYVMIFKLDYIKQIMAHYQLLRLKLNTLGCVAGASTHATMGSTSSAGPALAPAQDKADSVSLIASSSAGPALAPAQGKADSEADSEADSVADSEAAALASARGEGPASRRLS